MNHHVAIHGGSIIGEASSKQEAIQLCEDAGYAIYPEDNGGQIDFYDAEDGPCVAQYEPDGKGVWIIAAEKDDLPKGYVLEGAAWWYWWKTDTEKSDRQFSRAHAIADAKRHYAEFAE